MPGLFALITSLAMFKIFLLLMNLPACRVLVAMFLTFRISWSSKIKINFSLFILQFDSDTKMVNDTRTSVLVNLVVCYKINREWPLLLFDQSHGWSIWTIKNWDIFREKFPNIFISSWKRKTVKLTGLFSQWITDHLLCWGLKIPLILNFKSPPYIT